MRDEVWQGDGGAAYREMAADEERERSAQEWSEGVIGDSAGEIGEARKAMADQIATVSELRLFDSEPRPSGSGYLASRWKPRSKFGLASGAKAPECVLSSTLYTVCYC